MMRDKSKIADHDLGPEYFIPVSVYDEEGVEVEALGWVHGGQGSGTYALMSRLSADGETLASMEEVSDAIRSLEEGLETTSKEMRRAEEALEEGEEEGWSEDELDDFERELETLPEDYDKMLMSLEALRWMEREYSEQAEEIEEHLLEEEEKQQEKYREMEEENEYRRPRRY